MPAARWDVYRVGARIPSLDGLISSNGAKQVAKLQGALSAVACLEAPSLSGASPPATEDAYFAGRLLLGLVCRGWPSFASPAVEQALLEPIDLASALAYRETGPEGQIGWQLEGDRPAAQGDWDEAIQGALLRGDRRLGIDEAAVAMLTDSPEELAFYRDHLAPLLGQAIGWLELQRPIASMVRQDAPAAEHAGTGRVDFALELPGSEEPVKFVIELDGAHHAKPPQIQIDRYRDDLLAKHGWRTRRVPTRTLGDRSLNYLPGALRTIVERNPFPFTQIEGDERALAHPRQREATRLILTPHAVARVQLALCRAVMDGGLDLAAAEWSVAVVEREVPCAEIAVRDWLEALHHLCRLYGIPLGVERVRLLVAEEHLAPFPQPVWRDRPGTPTSVLVERLTEGNDLRRIDLAIDVSVGAHPTRRYPTDPLRRPDLLCQRGIALRTAQRQSGYTVDPWPAPRAIADPVAHRVSLEYFLQTLFRKRTFWPGQLPIIERVLRREDVIGLLPTGAGKSIIYQLPALLSPGLSLVIDPLKSLMQDQAENLAAAGVMDAIQINSDTPTAERPRIEWQFGQGEYRLVFISPERLQIQKFRDLLAATACKRPIAYVVIDETHCVSEWGHDFRTAYLNLGRIAADYCGRDGMRPPTVALTGTASESVLRDVQRELAVESDNAIVRPSDFARDELKFEIVPVPKGEKADALTRLIGTTIPERLGVPPDVLASGACGGIVFCPHVNGKLGVFEVAARIRDQLPQFKSNPPPSSCPDEHPVGFYSGEKPRQLGISDAVYADCKARIQRAFKAGRVPLLVATSAFGMGIDKPNIRYTIHYAMAKSVEAFAQEAGRAGRDRHDAVCAVLFTDRLAPRKDGTTPASEDCLERGIPAEEARLRAAASKWESDDAEVQMYLHSRSYQGVTRESAAVRAFFHHWIEPHLPDPDERAEQLVELTVGEADYREVIAALMAPMIPEDSVAEAADDPDDDGSELPRPELQRLIYRLSLLGIVGDYTVVYNYENNAYALSVRAVDEQTVVDHLRRYVARYRTSDRMPAVEAYLAASPLENAVCRCIDTLCWFVYEEIEQRRRQAMENMRQLLRESADGADLARRLNKMLSFTALTRTVFDVLRADDYRDWGRIAAEITAAESAERVYYQCRRALEDAPGHPGLLLLLGLAAQGMEGDRRDDVFVNLRDGLRQVRQELSVFSAEDQRRIADWVVSESARISPSRVPALLNRIVRQESDPLLAGAVLRAVDAGDVPADPILLRTCQRSLLHGIDQRLYAFLTG